MAARAGAQRGVARADADHADGGRAHGAGVGVIPDEMAAGDASLLRLRDCTPVPQKKLWLAMPGHEARSVRGPAFMQHMAQHLLQYAPAP
jgi:DNA-binding transcriptional LysR family regulator